MPQDSARFCSAAFERLEKRVCLRMGWPSGSTKRHTMLGYCVRYLCYIGHPLSDGPYRHPPTAPGNGRFRFSIRTPVTLSNTYLKLSNDPEESYLYQGKVNHYPLLALLDTLRPPIRAFQTSESKRTCTTARAH